MLTKRKQKEIVDLYREGFNHDYIILVTRNSLEDVRAVISKATADDSKLYQMHNEGKKMQ